MSIIGPNGEVGKIIGPEGPIGRAVGPGGVVWTSFVPQTVGLTSRGYPYSRQWDTNVAPEGSAEIISSLARTSASFTLDTICDRDVSGYSAGTRIPAGTEVTPSGSRRELFTFVTVK